MKKCMRLGAALLAAFCVSAQANVIWLEDFSDTSDWLVGYDPSGGSSISSDGSVGSLYVNGGGTEAAFIPSTGVAPFVPFDPANKAEYDMMMAIISVSGSMSYDIALDTFDASHNYVSTVWQVYPTFSTSTDTGNLLVNLGAYNFDSSVAYLMPKVTVHTGFGEQTLTFDELSFAHTSNESVPDPASSASMTAFALFALAAARRRV